MTILLKKLKVILSRFNIVDESHINNAFKKFYMRNKGLTKEQTVSFVKLFCSNTGQSKIFIPHPNALLIRKYINAVYNKLSWDDISEIHNIEYLSPLYLPKNILIDISSLMKFIEKSKLDFDHNIGFIKKALDYSGIKKKDIMKIIKTIFILSNKQYTASTNEPNYKCILCEEYLFKEDSMTKELVKCEFDADSFNILKSELKSFSIVDVLENEKKQTKFINKYPSNIISMNDYEVIFEINATIFIANKKEEGLNVLEPYKYMLDLSLNE